MRNLTDCARRPHDWDGQVYALIGFSNIIYTAKKQIRKCQAPKKVGGISLVLHLNRRLSIGLLRHIILKQFSIKHQFLIFQIHNDLGPTGELSAQ